MKLELLDYNELPEDLKESYRRRQDNYFLVITWSNGKREVHHDGMEPEDASFGRDLSWVPDIIQKAYNEGVASNDELSYDC